MYDYTKLKNDVEKHQKKKKKKKNVKKKKKKKKKKKNLCIVLMVNTLSLIALRTFLLV